MTLIPDKRGHYDGLMGLAWRSVLRTQSNTLNYLLIRAILSEVIALKYQL